MFLLNFHEQCGDNKGKDNISFVISTEWDINLRQLGNRYNKRILTQRQLQWTFEMPLYYHRLGNEKNYFN